MDEVAAAELAMAYVRRKKFEARILAIEVGKLFGGETKKRDGTTASLGQMAMWGIS